MMNTRLEKQINDSLQNMIKAFNAGDIKQAKEHNHKAMNLIRSRSKNDIKEMEESRKRMVKHG